MFHFHITGGVPLHGTVAASGSKNAALPMMAASILASEPVCLEGVPRLADVHTLSQVLEELGVHVGRRGGRNASGADCQSAFKPAVQPRQVGNLPHALLLESVDPARVRAPYRLVRRMRASFCVLGPLLARRGRAVVPLPGGCNIGDRPVDLHLKGLAALGASLRVEQGCVVAHARRLCGATIDLSGPQGPTVTGTANVLMAAVLAKGVSVIRGAAQEPEIVDLGEFLSMLGARIEGLGTSTIRVAGVEQLGGGTYRVIPDRIEAATLLLAAAMTRGAAKVMNVVPRHLAAVLEALPAIGCRIDAGADWVSIAAGDRPRAARIDARPYPGIPTDVQAQFTALLALADGRSTVSDHVFPQRFLHVAELRRLGAQIDCHDSQALITGVANLSGATVTACDLRASAALVLAGLAADGETVVEQIHHLDRGYERLDVKLRRLGARIARPLQNTTGRDHPSAAARRNLAGSTH